MASNDMQQQYETAKEKLIRNFTGYKAINKFRIFLYSLNKEVRMRVFEDINNFFKNEHVSTITTTTERERLTDIIKDWQWSNFENDSTTWWQMLVANHLHCVSLLTVIHMLVDETNAFDAEAFETSTDGIR